MNAEEQSDERSPKSSSIGERQREPLQTDSSLKHTTTARPYLCSPFKLVLWAPCAASWQQEEGATPAEACRFQCSVSYTAFAACGRALVDRSMNAFSPSLQMSASCVERQQESFCCSKLVHSSFGTWPEATDPEGPEMAAAEAVGKDCAG